MSNTLNEDSRAYADQYWPDYYGCAMVSFCAGALSDAAKEYWYAQFKAEQKQLIDIKDEQIKELKEALSCLVDYARCLQGEWNWKRNSTSKNDRQMSELDFDVNNADIILERLR